MKIAREKDQEWVAASHENQSNPAVYRKRLFAREDLPAGRVQMHNLALLPAGQKFQAHYHTGMHEIFTITDGQVVMIINETVVELDEGDAIIVEAGEVHIMENKGTEPAKYVVYGIIQKEGGSTVVVS